ncbi:hypothetical protein BDR07DRAFT_1478599 [Suillus spraguei]|nr:hypothetical protein BDR07DRAFT_1478599 [Suillus spraguei]
MAIEQSAQLAGPGLLIKPKPHPLSKKIKPLVSSLNLENAVMTMLGPKTSASGGANATQNAVNMGKNKYQDSKFTFKDGIKVNQKVSNTGVFTSSQTYVGSTDGEIKRTLEVGVRKWVKNVASKSQLQPSAPPSTRSAQAVSNNNSEWTEDVDAPEKFDVQMVRNWAGKIAKDASKGKKCAFSDSLEEEEECKIQDDPDVDEGPNAEDPVDNMDDDVKMVYQQLPEVNALEAQKEYAEYQLEDSCFMYEDPDNEDSPGAFLSEFILCVFAAHLNAIQGYEKIDIIDCGLAGHQTALALATAAAERALILAWDNFILLDDTSDNNKKQHKIALTLNQATNKISNTGTAFSLGNWEMDTIAYMERIDELSLGRILDIVA